MKTAFIVICAAVLPAISQAAPVVLAENTEAFIGGQAVTSGTNTWGAENFSLGSAQMIGSISFNGWIRSGSPLPPSIAWTIRQNAGMLPGTEVQTGSTSQYTSYSEGAIGVWDVRRFEFALGALALGAGDYWVAFHVTPDPFTGSDNAVYWSVSETGTSIDDVTAMSEDGGQSWAPLEFAGYDFTFRVTAADAAVPVPEPGSLALASFGIFAMLAMRRRHT